MTKRYSKNWLTITMLRNVKLVCHPRSQRFSQGRLHATSRQHATLVRTIKHVTAKSKLHCEQIIQIFRRAGRGFTATLNSKMVELVCARKCSTFCIPGARGPLEDTDAPPHAHTPPWDVLMSLPTCLLLVGV